MAHWEVFSWITLATILGVVAALVLRADGRSSVNRFFAGFLALVAAGYWAQWLSAAYPAPGQEGTVSSRLGFVLAAQILQLFDVACLIIFVGVFHRRSRWMDRWSGHIGLGAALAIVVTSSVLGRASLTGHSVAPFPHPSIILAAAFVIGGYAMALLMALGKLRAAQAPAARRDLHALVAGLMVVLVPRIALVERDLQPFGNADAGGWVILRVLLCTGVFAAATYLWWRRTHIDERTSVRRWIAISGLVVAFVEAFWISTIFLAPSVLASSLVYPLRWLFFAFVFGRALRRRSLLGLVPDRKNLGELTRPLLALGVVFFVIDAILRNLPGHGEYPVDAGRAIGLSAGLIAAALAVGPSARPYDPTAPEVKAKKLQAYRELVEVALDGGREFDDPDLAGHRRRLGLSRGDHDDVGALVAAERALREAREPAGFLPPDFRLRRVLATGTHTWTLEAEHGQDGARVAVKVVRPPWSREEKVVARFLQEAKLMRRLEHPNVVRLLSSRRTPPLLVLEYAEGGNLNERVRSSGPLAPAEVERLARDLLGGLRALHAAHIVHRDIKPENVLLRTDGSALLGDLGVAHDASMTTTRLRLTSPGQEMGTVLYMAPEQVRGRAADARTDLYALGAVIFFAATGAHYLGPGPVDEFELKRSILESRPRIPRHLAENVRSLLRSCLQKDPGRRPASAERALDLLSRRGAARIGRRGQRLVTTPQRLRRTGLNAGATRAFTAPR